MQIIGWLLCAVAAVAATPLDAQQLRVRTELVATSGYLWRGVTRHRFPVAQVFGSVERTTKRLDVGLSAWASGVTGSCGRPSCPEGTGPRVADVNASLLARYVLGTTQFALGANAYHFRPAPFESDRTSTSTWEGVASAYAIPSRHIQLALTAWMDFHAVDGLYVEATGTMPIALYRSNTPRLFITATGGWNRGQKTEANGLPVPGYFQRNGFTHVSLEAGYLLLHPRADRSGNTLQIFARVQGNLDPATKVSVWPFKRGGASQQIILGLALHPVIAHPPKRAVGR